MSNGITSFLFQGAAPVPAPTGSDTSVAFPQWLQTEIYNTIGAANNLANQPYTPYPGQQVATPSAQTTQAQQLAGQNVGAWQPYTQQGAALTAQASQPISAGQIQSYMNPYTSNVTGALANLAGTNLSQNILPSINDTFIRNGQFGSPQNSQLTGQAITGTQQSLLNAQAGALETGYQGALSAAQAQQGIEQSTGAQFGQLGALQSSLGANDVSQLAAAGQEQDTLAQQNINAGISNFQNQVQWPYANLEYASNIVRGLPSAGSTQQTAGTTYPTSYAPSPLAAGIGAAGVGSALGLRRGGAVRMARGGALRRFDDGGTTGAPLTTPNPVAEADLTAQGAGAISPSQQLAAARYYANLLSGGPLATSSPMSGGQGATAVPGDGAASAYRRGGALRFAAGGRSAADEGAYGYGAGMNPPEGSDSWEQGVNRLADRYQKIIPPDPDPEVERMRRDLSDPQWNPQKYQGKTKGARRGGALRRAMAA